MVLFATWLYSKPVAPKKEDITYIPLDQTKVDDDSGPIPSGDYTYEDGDLGVRSSTPSANDPKRYD